MMNKKIILLTTILNTAALGLVFRPQTASAVDLTFYDTFGNDTTTELWKVQGKIGGTSKELSIGSPETNVAPEASADWLWSDGQMFDWQLQWDNAQEIATFTISGLSEPLTYNLDAIPSVNGLQLTTFVNQESNKLEAGTSITLTLNSVNGEPLVNPIIATATNTDGSASGQNLYLASDSFLDGFDLAGKVSFDWPGNNPQNPQAANADSRVFFQLEANDANLALLDPFKRETVSTSSSIQTPEPSVILGLMIWGGGSLFAKLGNIRKK